MYISFTLPFTQIYLYFLLQNLCLKTKLADFFHEDWSLKEKENTFLTNFRQVGLRSLFYKHLKQRIVNLFFRRATSKFNLLTSLFCYLYQLRTNRLHSDWRSKASMGDINPFPSMMFFPINLSKLQHRRGWRKTIQLLQCNFRHVFSECVE